MTSRGICRLHSGFVLNNNLGENLAKGVLNFGLDPKLATFNTNKLLLFWDVVGLGIEFDWGYPPNKK